LAADVERNQLLRLWYAASGRPAIPDMVEMAARGKPFCMVGTNLAAPFILA
jgi:hypothetical protein